MQEDASKKLADLKEKEADTLATIAERQTDDNKDKWDQILRDNEEAAKKTPKTVVAKTESSASVTPPANSDVPAQENLNEDPPF